MSQVIPESHADLLEKQAFGNLGTLMKDGSPQVTPVWVDYDGKFVRFNSAKGRVKDKNIRRDPRVSISLQEARRSARDLQDRAGQSQFHGLGRPPRRGHFGVRRLAAAFLPSLA